GMENLRDAVSFEVALFVMDDDAAAAAPDFHITRAVFIEQVFHVLEILDVTALVRAHANGLRALLQNRFDHVAHGSIVTEVDHFRAEILQNSAHDVDTGIMSVEKTGRSDDANVVSRHLTFTSL